MSPRRCEPRSEHTVSLSCRRSSLARDSHCRTPDSLADKALMCPAATDDNVDRPLDEFTRAAGERVGGSSS